MYFDVRDWGAIFLESSRVLYEEVDYTREGKNAERFSENFKGTDWIKAPSINWSRSTSKASSNTPYTARRFGLWFQVLLSFFFSFLNRHVYFPTQLVL